MTEPSTKPAEAITDGAWLMLFAAWVLSLAATLGALFIGEVMGQTPCPLCWHQRAFMFPLPILLAIALLRNDMGVWRYAVPLSSVGALLAAYHVLEYVGFIPAALTPCTATGPSCSGPGMTVFGWIPIPILSLLAFVAIIGALVSALRRANHE